MKCPYCGVKEGELHDFGCFWEICPFCGLEFNMCCCGEASESDYADFEKKGRIPWVSIPLLCRLCGKLWPDFFNDSKWDYYVRPSLQKEILCCECYDRLKQLFPDGWKKKSYQAILRRD